MTSMLAYFLFCLISTAITKQIDKRKEKKIKSYHDEKNKRNEQIRH